MFAELTTPERQRVAQYYMTQMGGKSPADVGSMVQQLINNPDMASRAMSMFDNLSNGNSNSNFIGGSPNSNIPALMDSLMSQGETVIPTAAPIPKKVSSNNTATPTPPVKPTEFSGDDRVAKAGGPGSIGRTSAPTSNPTAVAENPSDASYSSDILKVLAALGLGGTGLYALGKMGTKQMPAEANVEVPVETNKAMVAQQPKVLPPDAGGPEYQRSGKFTDANGMYDPFDPRNRSAEQDAFSRVFGNDITDAEYRDVTPKQIDTQKKLTGPKETDNRDNVKKADGKTIVGEDETDDAGVKRTMNKAKTVKENMKPKVRIK